MTTIAAPANHAETQESWVPMIAIALGQMIMSFNVASLPVALSGMVKSFNVPPTTVATGIVAYSMLVAGFVMLGAKLVQRFGAARVFRVAVIVFCAGQALMTFSPTATLMITAQAAIGAAASVIVPALVALIAENYSGRQQATAVGALGSARALAGVLAFVIGGVLGTFIGWRPAFGILIAVSAIVFLLSFRLKTTDGRPDVKIDMVGVVLAAAAIILISFGFNNLNRWGLGIATAHAPFNLLGLSPAPIFIVVGIVLGQAFLMWTHRRQEAGKTPLLALDVIDSPKERAAVYALFVVVALEAALNFTVPLYIQIVQGQSPIATAVAMMPFNLTVFFTAMLVVRLYSTLTPQRIGIYGFILCTLGLLWLAFVVRNDWSAVPVLFGLITFGLGQGALVTLLFNVLVTASPKELAGDVGSLRGTTQNLAAAVGTAVARLGGRAADHHHAWQHRGSAEADARASGTGRSRQHQLHQQRPATDRPRRHDRVSGAGRRGRARQHGITPARAEDCAAHSRRAGNACDHPGQPPAELYSGRDSGPVARDWTEDLEDHRQIPLPATCQAGSRSNFKAGFLRRG